MFHKLVLVVREHNLLTLEKIFLKNNFHVYPLMTRHSHTKYRQNTR
jgi:hypothetical protein